MYICIVYDTKHTYAGLYLQPLWLKDFPGRCWIDACTQRHHIQVDSPLFWKWILQTTIKQVVVCLFIYLYIYIYIYIYMYIEMIK